MKKLFLLMFIAILTISVLSAGITIVKPKRNHSVMKGLPYNIEWTRKRDMNFRVKIMLFDTMGRRSIMTISNNAPNSGRYRWNVPANAPTGSFIIRIMAIKKQIGDDSSVFKIINKNSAVLAIATPVKPTVTLVDKRPDFVVVSTKLRAGHLVTKIKNIGTRWSGELSIRCGIGSRSFIFKSNLSVDSSIIEIITGGKIMSSDVTYPNPNVLLVIRLDPDNKIKEKNENNNVQSLMYKHNLCPDLFVSSISASRVPGTDQFKFAGTIKNIGNQDSPEFWVSIHLDSEPRPVYFKISSLKGGGITACSMNRKITRFKTHTFRVTVDAKFQIKECYENNNVKINTFKAL